MSVSTESDVPKRRARAISIALTVPYVEPRLAAKMPPTVIAASLYFEGCMSVTDLRSTLKERLLKIERFRSVLKHDNKTSVWLEPMSVEQMDMEYHVKDVSGGRVWKQSDINNYLGKMYGNVEEFDVSKPLWRFELVPTFENGRSVIFMLIDHSVGDGIATVTMLHQILDPPAAKPVKPDGKADGPKKQVAKRTSGPSMSITRRLWAFGSGAASALLGPVLPGDSRNILKEKDHRNPCKSKSCALGEHIPLEEFKDIKNQFPGATINDVMLAVLTLMLKRYFKENGESATNVSSNYMINVRHPKQNVLKESMRNEFSTGVFKFPLYENDPLKVVWAVKNQSDMTKNSPGPLILYKVLAGAVRFLNRLGAKETLINAALDAYGKVTVMLSNVPGPAETAHMCGLNLYDMSFYTFTPLGVYLGVLSYANRVSVGVVTGIESEPDAQNLAKHWTPAFRELQDAVKNASPKAFAKPADRLQLYTLASLGLLAALIGGGLWHSRLLEKLR